MAPSASKQKRLAEKAAKGTAKAKGSTVSGSTPTLSEDGTSSLNTPLNSLSLNNSQEDLTKVSMAALSKATDR